MDEAVRIEQRLHDLFAGLRSGVSHKPQEESPREMERRAMEHLYGERSSSVVLAERESPDRTR